MRVADVMTKKAVAVRRTDTLRKAARTLAQHRISGCPVVSGSRLVGVITKTDIVRAIDPHARIVKERDLLALVSATLKDPRFDAMQRPIAKALELSVKTFMNEHVISIAADDDIYDAAKLMNAKDIEMLPVVADNRLVGVLTRSDIVKMLGKL